MGDGLSQPVHLLRHIRAMLIRALLLLLTWASAAQATGPGWMYAVGTGNTPCASLQAANAAFASALGTNATTLYWFPLIALTNGSCAVKIVPGDPYYGTSVTLPPSSRFPSGMTVSISSLAALSVPLVSRASLAGFLPDVLTLANFEAFLTTPQLAALNSVTQAAHPQLYADWQAIQSTSVADMQDPTYRDLVSQALSLSLITLTEFLQLTTPTVTGPAAGPCAP